ncbi:MAG: hypothetical protein GY861_08775 [bacterium]|nr:hypothetical protein [bacterium]
MSGENTPDDIGLIVDTNKAFLDYDRPSGLALYEHEGVKSLFAVEQIQHKQLEGDEHPQMYLSGTLFSIGADYSEAVPCAAMQITEVTDIPISKVKPLTELVSP